MVRMHLFLLNLKLFDMTSYDELLKSGGIHKGKERYAQKMEQRKKEFEPVEAFIAEVGFENIRKIAVAPGGEGVLTYTIFYEDSPPPQA